MGVRVYGVEVGIFLRGGVWFFWWFHLVGIGVGIVGELGVEALVVMVWVLGDDLRMEMVITNLLKG